MNLTRGWKVLCKNFLGDLGDFRSFPGENLRDFIR